MAESRTIAFHTLGCKLNFAETSSIGKQFRDAGYSKVSMEDKPDVFLLNTCSVTENADRECRTVVNRALSVNPDAIVVVTGCFAQLKPESIASIPGVDLVLGASEKFNAPRYVDQGMLIKSEIRGLQLCTPAILKQLLGLSVPGLLATVHVFSSRFKMVAIIIVVFVPSHWHEVPAEAIQYREC